MHFNTTVSIGALIQLVTSIAIVVSLYWSTKVQIARLDSRVKSIERRQDDAERAALKSEHENKREINAMANEMRTSTAATHSRLDSILHALAFTANRQAVEDK